MKLIFLLFKSCIHFGILAVIFILISSTGSYADAPHPSLQEGIQKGKIKTPYYLKNENQLRALGINSPGILPDGSNPYGPNRLPPEDFRAIAILVDFSDNQYQVNGTFFDNLLFGTGTGTVRDYYNEVTYGNLTIVTLNMPSVLGWSQAPETYDYYVNNNNGFGYYPRNAQKLAEDAVTLVDPYVDFSQYDNNGDGYVDALFIIHAGPGAEFTGNDNDIWSHKWSMHTAQSVDGVSAYTYSMEPEYWQNPGDMTCGVYAHEMGHSVFGLPDVYDRDNSSRGLGRWSLMAGGSWNGPLGSSPAHPDAWCRSQMGYTTPVNLTTNVTNYPVPAIETDTTLVRLWTDGTIGNQYFLVENRQQVGYDAALPSSGLCIYHVDESVFTQNDNEWYPGHTGSGHYLVALEQADGLWQLEHDTNGGDGGDPFPESYNRRTFDDLSTPDTRSYAPNSTTVAVRNISNSKAVMTADFEVTTVVNNPDIKVVPTSFAFNIQENDTTSDVLSITNTASSGSQNLEWSIVEPAKNLNKSERGSDNITEVSWIEEDPINGTISPGNSQNVQISINGTGLTAGAYSCTLSVASNDPDENPVLVPVNLNVSTAPTNTPPVAVNDTATGKEDIILQIDVLTNDYDTDGFLDSRSVAITANPAHGQVSGDPEIGEVTYQPDLNYFGIDNFNYTVNDDQGTTSNEATVAITITSVNDPPVLTGIPDVTFEEDSVYTLPLNPYVSDVDHMVNQIDFLADVIEAGLLFPERGNRHIEIDPSDLIISIDPVTHIATFSNPVDSSGIFTVVFTAVDDSGATDTDTISVTVAPINDPPVISALPGIEFQEDHTLHYAVADWYPFVRDPETLDPLLGYYVIDGSNVSGDCYLDSCYFSAPENWFGPDTLWLVVSDGLASDMAALFVEVAPVNDPPFFSDLMDSLLIPADSSAHFCIWDYIADADGPDSLLSFQFTAISGNLQLNYDPLNGDLAVEPATGFSGTEVLHLEAWDDSSAYADDSITVVIEEAVSLDNSFVENIPGSYRLKQNYPNPFNPVTQISFSLPKTEQVRLEVFNICGQQVTTLANRQMEAGIHTNEFNGLNLASGIYFYKLETAGFVEIKKMILMK
jgi:immune inhibitor A